MSKPFTTVRAIASGLSIVTLGRMAAAGLGLLTQVYLAQMLSAAALGLYFLATSLAAFLAIMATCGLPLVNARFLVRYRRRAVANFSGLFLTSARRAVLVVSLVLMAIAAAAILAWPGLPAGERTVLLLGCLAVPSFAVSRLTGSAAAAYRHFQLSYLPDLVARPGLFLAAVVTLGLVMPRLDLVPVLAVFVVLAALQALYQDRAVRRIAPPGAHPRPAAAARLRRLWMKAALPLTGVILMTAIFADLAILSAGPFLDKADLAIFGICVKVALITGFVQSTAHKMLQPDMAEALFAGDRRRMSRAIAQANAIAIGVGIVAFLFVAVAGEFVLSIFGEHFVAGRNVLLAVVFGQILVAACGPAIHVLTLRAGQAAAWASVVAAVTLMAASALFIPPMGLAGAALALVTTQVLWAALLAFQVRRLTGVACDIFASGILACRRLPLSVPS